MVPGKERGLDKAGDLTKLTMDRNRKGFLSTSGGCIRREQRRVPGMKHRVNLRGKELEAIWVGRNLCGSEYMSACEIVWARRWMAIDDAGDVAREEARAIARAMGQRATAKEI